MKQDLIIPLGTGQSVRHITTVQKYEPTCPQCGGPHGGYEERSAQVHQLGRAFADFLYCHTDGQFYRAIRDYMKEKEAAS